MQTIKLTPVDGIYVYKHIDGNGNVFYTIPESCHTFTTLANARQRAKRLAQTRKA